MRERHFSSVIATVMVAIGTLTGPANAENYDRFIDSQPESFSSESEIVDAFKLRFSAGDKAGLAKLLGLNLAEVSKTEDFDQTFETMRQAAVERIAVENAGEGQRKLILGSLVWPFPFPIIQSKGKWIFDTEAGLTEVIYRRVGENELETISNCRAYLDAQYEYAAADHDGDGVLEFAQQVKSDEDSQNGLYWSEEQWGEPSPIAAYAVEAKVNDAATRKTGYFGYHYKILKGQGANIAGGRYDYVINGNMIAGFALVAWPAEYGVTGVKTFVVNHQGTVYEADLGTETAIIGAKMARFDPDKNWSLTKE